MTSSLPSITSPPPKDSKTVLLFWAPWHEASSPGSPLDQAIGVLSTSLPSLKFFRVEAEECVNLSTMYGVAVVPTVVLINKDGSVWKRVQGEDVAAVTTAVQQLANLPETGASSESAQQQEESLTDRLNRLISTKDVMLFMKGTPTEPKCGFSRQAVELLKENEISFGSFDILSDEEVRQGLKKHSDWPTYPQLYANGELVGGLDIMKELSQESGGGLREQLGLATSEKVETLDDRLEKLVNRSKVMVFMKGFPSAPRCGFSRQLCDLLNDYNVAYDSFDILSDEEVRQGLKEYSDWPTYPQLYVNGDLVGGLDICKEMAESGELKDLLEGA